LHIGKSSAGWCFSLHVDDSVRSLDDWRKEWSKPGTRIVDEYGGEVTREDMERTITDRQGRGWDDRNWPEAESRFHAHNYSQRGPNGLLRHRLDDSHCIGHGDGTYDLITGDFS
jgi:hypothetical protein